MSQVLLTLAVLVGLIVYGAQNWQIFRSWLVLCLPSGLIAFALASIAFSSPDFWRNLLGGAYIALFACAFLTHIQKTQKVQKNQKGSNSSQ